MLRVVEESPPVKEAMGDGGINDHFGDTFPFAALPDELIGHTFSFLSIKDRMRARVNESKYHVEELIIREHTRDIPRLVQSSYDKSQRITFLDEIVYSSDCIRRLTHNVSIGYLNIKLNGTADFHREVFNLIKEFHIGKLRIHFENDDLEEEMVVDSFFLDLTRACREFVMYTISDNITPQALHQVYKMMMDKSTKLRKVHTLINDEKQLTPLLGLIGITCRDGLFFSERNIEVIQKVVSKAGYAECRTSLFDGSLEISFILDIYEEIDGSSDYFFGFDFSFELHETEESLNNAKNRDGYVKINVDPQ